MLPFAKVAGSVPVRNWVGRFALALGLAAVVLPGTSRSEELQNFIKDLYGGNGIFLAVSPGAFNHSAHFASDSLTQLTALNHDITGNLSLTSLSPAAPTISFNILQGMPSESTTNLGPIFGERAETIGQGRFSVAASFSHEHFTTLNGQNLNDVPIVLNHEPVPGCSLGIPACSFLEDQVRLDINLNVTRDVFAFYAEYGVTDRWDVGIILPVVIQTAQASSVATIINNSGTTVHRFDATHPSTSHTGGTASGIGDVILRTKYTLLSGAKAAPDIAIFGQVNTPTGDQSNLLGSGSTDVMAGVIASKQLGPINPHINIGYQVASGGFDRNNVQYAVGADYSFTPNVAVAGDFVGRWYTGAGKEFDTTDVSIGVKWRPIGQHVLVADFLIPVNKGTGLRPDYIAFAGYQYSF